MYTHLLHVQRSSVNHLCITSLTRHRTLRCPPPRVKNGDEGKMFDKLFGPRTHHHQQQHKRVVADTFLQRDQTFKHVTRYS